MEMGLMLGPGLPGMVRNHMHISCLALRAPAETTRKRKRSRSCNTLQRRLNQNAVRKAKKCQCSMANPCMIIKDEHTCLHQWQVLLNSCRRQVPRIASSPKFAYTPGLATHKVSLSFVPSLRLVTYCLVDQWTQRLRCVSSTPLGAIF